MKVALFEPQGKRLWLDRKEVTLLSLRKTWSYIWSHNWTKPNGQHQRAFSRLFKHLLMLASRFGRLYVGPESGGMTLEPNQCFAPASFFVSLSDPLTVQLTIRSPGGKSVEAAEISYEEEEEQEKNVENLQTQKPKRKKQRKRTKCKNRGCKKKGCLATWGVACYLCPIRYCSSECRDQDTPRHAFECTLELADDPVFNHLANVPLSAETMELVQEELQQWDALFGSNDTIQFVDSSIEMMVQGQDESSVCRSGGDDGHNERTFVEADDLMGLKVGDCDPAPADTQFRGLIGGQDRSG